MSKKKFKPGKDPRFPVPPVTERRTISIRPEPGSDGQVAVMVAYIASLLAGDITQVRRWRGVGGGLAVAGRAGM